MIDILIKSITVGLAVLAFLACLFFATSIWEKEKRAVVWSGVQFIIVLLLALIFLFLAQNRFFDSGTGFLILLILFSSGFGACILLLARMGKNPAALEGSNGLIVGSVSRPDEREIVFTRNDHLKPDTDNYREFYQKHPQWEKVDAERRELGGPLGKMGKLDKPNERQNTAALLAASFHVMHLSGADQISPPGIIRQRQEIGIEEATRRIKGFAKALGADLVGIAEVDPHWRYSHRGMASPMPDDKWGAEIVCGHRFAIVFAMEMSLEMVETAPHTPTSIESMRVYGIGAGIATRLAAYIANLGHPASAEHLAHYNHLLVPLAVDAGLGELGRHGYLVSKKFGPRIRLGAVTTDMPLLIDPPVDIGVRDFCRICEKCRFCCPSNSIPEGPPQEVNGSLRWKLNAETCFRYWGKIGGDCNICMRVCPWSHARTLPHRLIVWAVSRNSIARRLFFQLDDLFYSKRPKPKPGPTWAQYQ